jgi:transposase
MIAAPPGVRVYLACGTTDMRKGMAGLAMQVQQVLAENPFGGAVFAFRGKTGGLIKGNCPGSLASPIGVGGGSQVVGRA